MTGVAPVAQCIYDGPKATPTTPPDLRPGDPEPAAQAPSGSGEPPVDPPESGSGGSEGGSSEDQTEPPATETREETPPADEKVGVSDDVELTPRPAPEGEKAEE
jgi:hypothetical protein